MPKRLFHLAGLALWMASAVATADDKDLLKKGSAPPNMLIVFGNSQTTEQPIQGASSAWDGDADSPASKMGTAKAVLQQFINQKHGSFNFGMSAFSHGSDAGSVIFRGKSWLYSPLVVDFPKELAAGSWGEPVGTIERWGPIGEGPCTNLTSPACTDRSPNFITLPAQGAVENCAQSKPPAGCLPFFGVPTASAFICLDGTLCNDGSKDNATKRIMVTLLPVGKYGDAFTNGTLSSYTIPAVGTIPAHSMEVTKVYQAKLGGGAGTWTTQALTPHGDPGTVTVPYVPTATLPPDLFYTTGPDAGKEIGFLNDDSLIPVQQRDLSVGGTCSGWEFQSNSATTPLIKIPRDYKWGATCAPPQDSLPCANRLLRPQAKLVSYNQGTGVFTGTDYDNPGYATGDDTHKYDDGCDKTLLGAVDTGNLNVTGRQAILVTQNGNQVPLKNLLSNIYDYFTKSSIDGFVNGKRTDDPNNTCRVSAVILIYDSFNGCQGDVCNASVINAVETPFKQIGVPVYVIGFGASASANAAQGICIAQNTGAFQADGTTPGYYPVTDAVGLFQSLSDITSILDQATQTFSTAAVSTSQALGDQMAYFASFSASKERSIWNGRLGGYRLDASGNVQTRSFTVKDPTDPANLVPLQVPSNASGSLIWNAGANLLQTHGTGATVSTDVLGPGDQIHTGTYTDDSNDIVNTAVPTNFYLGRKIVFSLPKGYTSPVTTLPIPAGNGVPETRHNMVCPDLTAGKCSNTTGVSWWPDLKALLGPQTAPPAVLSPALTDADAGDSLRFIWGDRDAVTGTTVSGLKYCDSSGTSCQKLGDIFHSGPLLVGGPNDFSLFKTNAQGYTAFSNTYHNRRRVLYVGANDGLLHAFDAGAFGRDTSKPSAYDLGTGAELFAFAPRAIMQIYKPLKDAVGAQSKNDEWTVDLSPSAADVFIDASHSGTPVVANRAWHTVLLGGVREGSPFEGTSGAAPKNSQGSYYALDITQPDALVGGIEGPGDFTAPACLNKSGDASCARDWPTVLWEITDTGDLDASGSPGSGYPDMGETWAKASMGRIKVCASSCGTSSAVNEDHYVAIFGGGFDRERKNRRGNWLYMVDIETGKTLYKVNSSCGVNSGSGACTPTYFGSIPSEPAALDYNDDGYLDLIYVGDQKGQLWRIDLTDLRKLLSPPGGSFNNQLDLASGTGMPFLFFQAPQPTSPATTPFYPIYFRPEAITLGYNSGGRPALGIAFGTGDRDDILGNVDPSSLTGTCSGGTNAGAVCVNDTTCTGGGTCTTNPQRFYYIVDAANNATRTESNLHPIPSSIAPVASADPLLVNGWFLKLSTGERVVGDSLAIGGVIRFPTYNPISTAAPGSDACANPGKCTSSAGTSRLFQVYYNNGNAYLGASDRGQTQPYAMFITAETSYLSGSTDAHGIYWSGGAKNPPLGLGKKITVRSWKEKSSRP